MVRLGVSGHSVGSYMVSPTSPNGRVVHSREKIPQVKREWKVALMEFLGRNSGAGIVGGGSGASG